MLSVWRFVWGMLTNDRTKFRVYIFLNRPSNWIDWSYQFILGLLITTCMVLTLFSSFKEPQPLKDRFIYWLDLLIAIIFGMEFILRLWSSTCFRRYRNWRGIHIIFHPMFMLDLFVLGTTITVLCYDIQETMLAVGLRGFRMLHFLENRYKLWKIVSTVVWSQRYQLAIVTYFCIIWWFVFSLAIYFVESKHNPQMTSLSKALWFTLVTFTTVGYGDIVPVSSMGKVIVSLGMIVGVSIFALPGGVIGAGLALKVQNQRLSSGKKPQHSMREQLAASILQNAWRLHQIKKHLKMIENSGSKSRNIPISLGRKRIRLLPIPDCSTSQKNYQKKIEDKKMNDDKAEIDIELIAKPSSSKGIEINGHLLYFIYLLRYHNDQRRFRTSRRLSDTNNFYDIYVQNSSNTAQMLKTLQGQLSKLENIAEDLKCSKNSKTKSNLKIRRNLKTQKIIHKAPRIRRQVSNPVQLFNLELKTIESQA